MKLKTPKALFFDLDNTFYDYNAAHRAGNQALCCKIHQENGLAEALVSEAYETAREKIKIRLGQTASSHSRLLYIQAMLEELAFKPRASMLLELEQCYWRTYLMNSKLYDGVVDLFVFLKAVGIPTVVVTDLTSAIQFRKLIYFGLDGYVDYVVTSEESGSDKYSLASFELALEKTRLDRSEVVWMVGDDACDVGILELMPNAEVFIRRGTFQDHSVIEFEGFDQLLKKAREVLT